MLSDRDALFLVADGLRPGNMSRGCPGGLLDPDDTVKRRRDVLKAAAQVRVVPRDVITAVYGGQGPPKKMRYKPTASPHSSAGTEEAAPSPADFMAVVVKFPPSYPMDVQTMDLPLHYRVGQTIRYMLDVALVSEERVDSLGESRQEEVREGVSWIPEQSSWSQQTLMVPICGASRSAAAIEPFLFPIHPIISRFLSTAFAALARAAEHGAARNVQGAAQGDALFGTIVPFATALERATQSWLSLGQRR